MPRTQAGELLARLSVAAEWKNHACWAAAALMENGTQTRHIWTLAACELRWTTPLPPRARSDTRYRTSHKGPVESVSSPQIPFSVFINWKKTN